MSFGVSLFGGAVPYTGKYITENLNVKGKNEKI